MKDFHDYESKYSIKEENGKFNVYLDGKIENTLDDEIEAQDFIYDQAKETAELEYSLHCDFCDVYFQKDEPEHRIEDDRFTAPYGSTFVMGGDVSSVPVCPVCREDLEEV